MPYGAESREISEARAQGAVERLHLVDLSLIGILYTYILFFSLQVPSRKNPSMIQSKRLARRKSQRHAAAVFVYAMGSCSAIGHQIAS